MKIRIIAVVYTILMVLVLRYVLNSFGKNDFEHRNMVYYNDVIEQISEAYNNGEDIESIEKKYSCDIILNDDEDYTSAIFHYYSTYGLVVDFTPEVKDESASDEIPGKASVIGKICFATEENSFTEASENARRNSVVIWCAVLIAGYILLVILYINYVRPFRELQHFTTEIAKGNLDVMLPMHRENMFGAFTESFDVMREELAASRMREAEAEKSKKELVAQLSHDIKTPVSTIKATCEVLEMKEKIKLEKLGSGMGISDNAKFGNMRGMSDNVKPENEMAEQEEKNPVDKILTADNINNAENNDNNYKLVKEINGTLEKIGYISDKADTIDQLISNMFHATLEELEVLEVKPVETDSRVLNDIIGSMSQAGNIVIDSSVPECLVYMDRLRMEQVIGNVIQNSLKYAGTDIMISYSMVDHNVSRRQKDRDVISSDKGNRGFNNNEQAVEGSDLSNQQFLRITISDKGPGVPKEELDRVTEKFYRGSNSSGRQGSGLGLYLAGFFMEKQMGGFECYNDDGFVVNLFLKKV